MRKIKAVMDLAACLTGQKKQEISVNNLTCFYNAFA